MSDNWKDDYEAQKLLAEKLDKQLANEMIKRQVIIRKLEDFIAELKEATEA